MFSRLRPHRSVAVIYVEVRVGVNAEGRTGGLFCRVWFTVTVTFLCELLSVTGTQTQRNIKLPERCLSVRLRRRVT